MQYINYNDRSTPFPSTASSRTTSTSIGNVGAITDRTLPVSNTSVTARLPNFHRPHFSMDGQTMVSAFDWEPRPLRSNIEGAAAPPPPTMANTVSVPSSLFSGSDRSGDGVMANRMDSKVSADSIVSLSDRAANGTEDGLSEGGDWDIESIPDVNPDECVITSDEDDGWLDRLPLPEDEVVPLYGTPMSAASKLQESSVLDRSYSDAAIATAAQQACPLLQQAVDMISSSSNRTTSDEDSQQGINTDVDDDGSQSGQARFRDYQACQWSRRFQQLVEYKNLHGHVSVPHTSQDAPSLGRWVKRQRYQCKLWQEGKKESTMTLERVQALQSIKFVWESHEGTWDTRYNELKAFFNEHGHSNVPSNHPNKKLSTWVKYQRRQYKIQKSRENSSKPLTTKASHLSLTHDRITKLQALGFEWQLRRCRGGGK